MTLTEPLRDAVVDRQRAVDAVAVTTLLVATFDLLVPAVVLAGYLVRLLRSDDGLPAVDETVSLLETGVRAVALAVLPAAPVAAAWAVATALAPAGSVEWFVADLLAGRIPAATVLLRSLVAAAALVAGAFLAPLSGYVALVLVARFAETGFTAALATAPLRRALTDRRNVRAAAAVFVALVCGGVAAALAGFLPLGPVSRLLSAGFLALGTLAAAVLWRAHAPPTQSAGDDAATERTGARRVVAPSPRLRPRE